MPRALIPAAKVRAASCRSCGGDVLEGRTAAGLDVVVDAAQLSAVGELQASMAGVGTLTHHQVPSELHHRSAWSIRARPAGSRPRQSVHARHQCGQAWPALDTGRPDPGADVPDDSPPF